jgi:murein DD-endopeptidase MepM/ murein hydrolase activator NlpD
MTFPYRLLIFSTIIANIFGVVSLHSHPSLAQTQGRGCQTPALERFRRHTVVAGETLASIAQRYNLTPTTIIAMNPVLGNSKVSVGSVIQIPPYNGIVVEVPRGQTWRQIAAKYKIRPDALFEANGCQKNPRVVFVPSKQSSNSVIIDNPNSTNSNLTPSQLLGYPLPQPAKVLIAYGWQTNPTNGEVLFHSGIDLSAEKGTPVQAIGDGTVAFAKEQGTYGNLVIINHSGGLQSRYAHLDSIKVSVGQSVKKGDVVGSVGTTGTPTVSQSHLHFEVRSSSSLGWKAQDPQAYLQK